MADARVVANRFLELAEADGQNNMTPMQLLKLVYIAHGWMLGLYNRPLIDSEVEAWQYGPVIPDLYNAVKGYKSGGVRGPLDLRWGSRAEELDAGENDLVSQVYGLYGHMNGVALSRITHAANTPWSQIYSPGRFGEIIPRDLIADHYARLARERRKH